MRLFATVSVLLSTSAWAGNGPLSFQVSGAELAKSCEASLRTADARFSELARDSGGRSYNGTIRKFAGIEADLIRETGTPIFLTYVSPDKAVREAGKKCEEDVSKFLVDVYGREDLYRAVRAYSRDATTFDLNAEEKKLMSDIVRSFRRGGFSLPAGQRKEYVEIRKKIAQLSSDFQYNIDHGDQTLEFTMAELEGLPESYIARLEKTSKGTYKVSTQYPDYFPFMQNAKSGKARKRMQAAFDNRAADKNVTIFKEALRLRSRAARMIGYPSHAAFVDEDRMAGKPERIMSFLKDMKSRLRPGLESDLSKMLVLKRLQEGESATSVEWWDWRYYDNLIRKKEFNIDQEAVREYFPLDIVLKGMFKIYETLFGVEYREIQNADVWHPEVRLFSVSNRGSKTPMSYFYVDLFPRDAKFGHAAQFSIVSGEKLSDGTYRKPIVALVANFNRPAGNTPSLLSHGEVNTLFHEFGHVMHSMVTTAQFAKYAGTNTRTDFVEAPSQMLQNWVWDSEMLKLISGHYQDPSRHLPEDLLQRMITAKNLNNAVTYSRQLLFGLVDMSFHMSNDVGDTTELWSQVQKDVMIMPMVEGTHPEANIGHLMGGYDAGYYGYMWSEVFSADMFTRFQKEGLLNPKTGMAYRRQVLQAGGSKEPDRLLANFLGRQPLLEPFLRSVGLQ
jgi:thimet oligopeptidase